MTRRTRTAALVSAAALLVSGSISLGFAGSALAADEPVAAPAALLPVLVLNPASPAANSDLEVTGSGCLNGTDATGGIVASTVSVTVKSADGSYNTTVDQIDPNSDGTWSSNSVQPFTLGSATGDYTVTAQCITTLLGQPLSNDYPDATFTIDPATTTPPAPADPSVVVNPSTVAAGGSVSIGGTGFTDAKTATVTITGIGTKNADVSGDSFAGVSFPIPATQPGGTVNGTVTTDNNLTKAFSFAVTATSVDGPVPTSSSTPPTTTGGGTTVSNSGSGFDGSSGSSNNTGGTTAAKPKLPNTGADTVWPGVVGGLLVLTGAGLLWAGRRREDAEPTAA